MKGDPQQCVPVSQGSDWFSSIFYQWHEGAEELLQLRELRRRSNI